MAIAYVTSTSGSIITSSGAFNAPASIVSGNLLVAMTFAPNGGGVWTPPSGWTTYDTFNGGSGPGAIGLFYKYATGSEPSTYTFGFPSSGSGVGNLCAILQYSGTATATPLSSDAFNSYFPASTFVAGSSYVAVTGEMRLCLFGSETATISSGLSAMTLRESAAVGSGRDGLISVYDKLFSTVGYTGNATATMSASDNGATASVLILPFGASVQITSAAPSSVSADTATPQQTGPEPTSATPLSVSTDTAAPVLLTSQPTSAHSTSVSSDTAYPNIALPPPLPKLTYLIAFNNEPYDDPNLITGVAAPAGTLGAVNVWTDISPWVLGYRSNRGRQHDAGQFQAGTATLTVNNNDGRFFAWNTSSPYTGLVAPEVYLRIASGSSIRFTGHVNAWTPSIDQSMSGVLQIDAADALRLFNTQDLVSSAYSTQVKADGATTYYRCGEAGGTVAVDSSGGGHNGTYSGTLPTFLEPGALFNDTNTAVNFGGAGYIALGSQTVTSHFTVEMWVNPSLINATYGNNLFYQTGNGGTGGTGAGYINLTLTSAGDLHIAWCNTSGAVQTLTGGTALPLSTWTHVVVTSNGSYVSLYQNGAFQVSGGLAFGSGPSAAAACSVAQEFFGTTPFDFSGMVDEVALYQGVSLTATQIANHYTIATTGGFPQQLTGARVVDALAVPGWPTTAQIVDTGLSTCQANTQSLTKTSLLSFIQTAEATEAGALFVQANGVVRFISRAYLYGSPTSQPYPVLTTVQATFGDGTGAVPFQAGAQPVRDDVDIYGQALVLRQGGNDAVYTDPTSPGQYGTRTWQPASTVLYLTDSESYSLGQFWVNQHAQPIDRFDTLTVDMTAAVASGVQATLLALDLLYRVEVTFTNLPGGGTAFSQQFVIEHISETVAPNSWKITFALSGQPALPVLTQDQGWVY